jgi:hypothetical protein
MDEPLLSYFSEIVDDARHAGDDGTDGQCEVSIQVASVFDVE